MKKRLLSLCIGLPVAASLLGIPAMRRPVTVVQPDGSRLTVLRTGDERSHLVMTSDSMLLAYDGGAWCYAAVSPDGAMKSTGVAAVDPAVRPISHASVAMRCPADLPRRRAAIRHAPDNALPGLVLDSTYPMKGNVKALVILVEYDDVKFTLDNPRDYFYELLNGDDFTQYGGAGSARRYFEDASTGQFHPVFDVAGPVKLPENRAYYGTNSAPGEGDKSAYMMLVHAAPLIDDDINFADYDMDGDGLVDNIYIFYAGQGENSYGTSDCVWPHAWELKDRNAAFKLDGVTISRYACSNEWAEDRPEGIGTFIHEFSHVMGLPDLYDTSWGLPCTPHDWDVMDHGPYNNEGRTPPTYSIFERAAMGWLQPQIVTEAANCSLRPIGESNAGYMIPTASENEYFLMENRQQSGWDTYLPSHGMLIWHIDYEPGAWRLNVVNNTGSHQRVEIEKANNDRDGYDDDVLAGWAFPGSAGNTAFSSSTLPSMDTWKGTDLGLPLDDITEHPDGTITFTVAGGRERVPAPQALEVVKNDASSFTLSWGAVPEASDYLVYVSLLSDGEDTLAQADMGSGKALALPDGWKSTSTAKYSSEGNFGKASPSLKMDTDGDYIDTPVFDCGVRRIQFWYKGQQTENSSLETLGLSDGEWLPLGVTELEKGKAGIQILEDIPHGISCVRILFHRGSGYAALDDIIVEAGPDETPLDGYEGRSTGGALTAEVALSPSAAPGRYRCRVSAADGQIISRKSDAVTVDMRPNGVDGRVIHPFRICGHKIVADSGVRIDVYDVSGCRVASGLGSVTVRQPGLYIVCADESVGKVVFH